MARDAQRDGLVARSCKDLSDQVSFVFGLHQGPMCLLQRYNQLDSWLCPLFGEIFSVSPLRARIDGLSHPCGHGLMGLGSC
jgi:hypothetical protein